MKPTKLMVATAAVGAFALTALAQEPTDFMIKKGAQAPKFTTVASDDKQYALTELLKKGPVFLYFVKEHCGANPQAVPHFNSIAKAYEGKNVTFLAVINADKKAHSEWAKTFKSPTTALLDPDKKLIKEYKIRFSQSAVMVAPDGTVAKVFPGYGQASLDDLNASMAGVAKMEVPKLDFSNAPKNPRFG